MARQILLIVGLSFYLMVWSAAASSIRFNAIEGDPSDRNRGDEAEVDQIVGGTAVREGAIPYQAALLRNGGFFCGGSLIASNYILTAGHCCKAVRSPKDLTVVLNSIKYKPGERSRNAVVQTVTKIIMHEKYSEAGGNIENDVCLLKLSAPVNLKSAKLPAASCNPREHVGKTATTSGWGQTTPGQSTGQSSSSLLQVKLTVMCNVQCQEKYKNTSIKISNSEICAYDNGKDSCFGDSGGPLVVDGVLVGVVSGGGNGGCAAVGEPGYYARVSCFMSWINKNKQ
ncbi:trypsin alpha-3-like [Daphnia carinata]|uniref:trypsin alpha-3-like n=1 Tax=Daphnia carinata TaxID=120202 RepID=UPI00257F3547|nr:trypsin alpha-3-like [Daphnia carinata]